MTPEQAATSVVTSLWVQFGFLGLLLILGFVMLRENKKDKELIRQEKKEQELKYEAVLKEVKDEAKQSQQLILQRADEHSKELLVVNERSLAMNERSNAIHEKNNQIVGKFVDIAEECSRTRACKADQLQARGGGD